MRLALLLSRRCQDASCFSLPAATWASSRRAPARSRAALAALDVSTGVTRSHGLYGALAWLCVAAEIVKAKGSNNYPPFSGARSIYLMEKRQLISHAEARRILRRVGYPQERIDDVLRQLPDPIDTERDGEAVFKLGVSRDTLMDRLGGSP